MNNKLFKTLGVIGILFLLAQVPILIFNHLGAWLGIITGFIFLLALVKVFPKIVYYISK